MKPFDLEKAKAGAPVCTRSGRPVRIICFDRKGSIFPIIGLITKSDGSEIATSFREDGKNGNDGKYYKEDLFMVGEKKQGWMAVFKADGFPDNVLAVTSSIYASKEEVEAFIRDMRELDPAAAEKLIGIRQIELEE